MKPNEVGPERLLLLKLMDHLAANNQHALSQNEACSLEPPIGRESERAEVRGGTEWVLAKELGQEDQEHFGRRRRGNSPPVRFPRATQPDISGSAPQPQVPVLVFFLSRQEEAHLQPLMGMEPESHGSITGPRIAARQRLRSAPRSAQRPSLTGSEFSGIQPDIARERRERALGVGPVADDDPGIF
jgi:hypothetical protein